MPELKLPVYALLVAPELPMRFAILSGEKYGSLREGHRDYRVGRPLMLCCQIDPWCVMADITHVSHTTVGTVSPAEFQPAGFDSRHHVLDDLRRFYAGLQWESPITVIHWTNVRGKLVNDHKAKMEYQKRRKTPYPSSR